MATKKNPPPPKPPAVKLPLNLPGFGNPRRPGTSNPGPMFQSELDILDILGTHNGGPMELPEFGIRGTNNGGPNQPPCDDDSEIK
jgi:hypothetical protein